MPLKNSQCLPFSTWWPGTGTISEVHPGVGPTHGIAEMSIPESKVAPHRAANRQNIFH